MKWLKTARLLLILPVLIQFGCSDKDGKKTNLNAMANEIGRKTMVEQYPKVPQDDLIRETSGNMLYGELQNRYSQQLTALKAETDADNVKLIIVTMTPEVGKYGTNANTYGVPFIVQICSNQGIDCVDKTPDISEWASVNTPGRGPIGSNWSKAGAAFAANMLAGVVANCEGYRNSKTFSPEERPKTFGDATMLNSNDDQKTSNAGDEKNNQYRVKINKQGLRMGHELTFPKTQQRIVFMGDSRIYNPFIDDENTITELLQSRFPDREIVNAGNLSYTMDDYLSLYREKIRYAEPDVLVVCTNGGDILDEYFSHRNRYSRLKKCYKPSGYEKQFYSKMYKGS